MNEQIKSMLKEAYSSMIDDLVDMSVKVYEAMAASMPVSLPEEKKLDLLKTVMSRSVDSLKAGLKNVVPNDLAEKLKEKLNAGK